MTPPIRNYKLGRVRQVTWKDENVFQGVIRYGAGNQIHDVDFGGKTVLVIGAGAFASENTRTAIEKGAARVVLLCRRRGVVLPSMIEYLSFVRPFDRHFMPDANGTRRIFQELQAAYKSCGASPPEC